MDRRLPRLFSRWVAPLAAAMLLGAPWLAVTASEVEGPQLLPLERGPAASGPLASPWPTADRPSPDASTGPPPLEEPAPVAGPSTPWPAPQPPGAFMLLACEPASRSERLELVAREADVHTRLAFPLAGRGAYFAAREEFIMALRLVAQGLDGEHRTTVHSRALAAALTALKEAEDFIPAASRLEADLDLSAIIAGHRTPVLQGAQDEKVTPLVAMQTYLTFAQEQLAIAARGEVAGSMALYGLGKLHAAMAQQQAEPARASAPKAMAFYQAALLVNPRNYLASNDLGVLLAQAGRHEDARVALEHSVSISRHWETWQSLAKVYRQLGQARSAQYAEQQAAAAQQALLAQRNGRPPTSAAPVQWVDPKTLAQSPVSAASPSPPQPTKSRPKGWSLPAFAPPSNKVVALPPVTPADRQRK